MNCSVPGFPVLHYLPEFLKFMSIELMMPSNHLISSFVALSSSCPQSFPESESFPVSWLFTYGGQSIGASASVLPMNIKGWLTGLNQLSICRRIYMSVWHSGCPKDSQESCPTPQFESINSLALSLLYGPTLTSVHDYWKNHSFDYMDLCWQSDASAF